MKKFFALILSVIMTTVLMLPAYASGKSNFQNNSENSKHTIEKSIVEEIDSRAMQEKAIALEILAEMPQTQAAANSVIDTDELLQRHASLSTEIEVCKEDSLTKSNEKLEKLYDEKQEIELILASQGIIYLTSDEVEQIYGSTEILAHPFTYDTGVSPASWSDSEPRPVDTRYNEFAYKTPEYKYGYYTFHITVSPIAGPRKSVLYDLNTKLEEDLNVTDYLKKSISYSWRKIEDSVLNTVSLGFLRDVLDSLEEDAHKYNVKTFGYNSTIEGSVDARFYYVYNSAEDRYSNELIAHSVFLHHVHYAVGAKLSDTPKSTDETLPSNYYSLNSGIKRAVEHFESGNGVTEISRVGTVTYKVGSSAFQTFLPAWVSSLNQIN